MSRVYRPSHVRVMAAVECAWVGAVIDTDGTAMYTHSNHGRRPRATIQFYQMPNEMGLELLSALFRATGVGYLTNHHAPKLHEATYGNRVIHSRTPLWGWGINARNEVMDIIRQCWPYSVKLQRLMQKMWE